MSGRGLEGLLGSEPRVVTAGADLFTEALRQQRAEVTSIQWRPPVEGGARALAAIMADRRRAAANDRAVARMTSAVPMLVDIGRAADRLALGRREFLHAGPPIDYPSASGPLRGALIGAVLYEGLCDTPEQADHLLRRGGITLAPCHSRGAVGPMAGVVSPSMPVLVVEDATFGGQGYCTLNEGLGKVLRYGAYEPAVLERLRWMRDVLAPILRRAVHRHGPIDIKVIVAQALQMGDEGHNRNRAATSLFLRLLAGPLVRQNAPEERVGAVADFIAENDHFFLNVVMAGAKVAADTARDIAGSTVVVAMARNGTEFGIQTSGTGDRWFTGPAAIPDGLYLGGYGPDDASPDIGDSTITEVNGIGGFAMAAAPAIVAFVGGSASDAVAATRSMYAITLAEHPAYKIPFLEFRGSPTGIDVTRVVRTGVLPIVNTGIAGKVPGTGQVGAGLATPPMAPFLDATVALGELARRAA